MQTLKDIRAECRLSIGVFAKCLGIPKATYQCYESNTRTVPPVVLREAEAQLERSRKYWSEMDARLDAHLKGGV
jgi:predicted transcriptional regulator